MKFFIEVIDRFDGRTAYSIIEADSLDDARNRYLKKYPIADIRNIGEIPDGCMTVIELRKKLEELPYCLPVYINSNSTTKVSNVFKCFNCVEIS